MNEINFLPEVFQRVRRRQRRRPIELGVIGLTLATMTGLWLTTSGPDSVLAYRCAVLDQDLAEIEALRAERGRLVAERSQLQQRLVAARETYQPISATQVISRLSGLTPEPIQLTDVQIDTERPKPQAQPKTSTTKKVVGKPQAAKPAEPNRMNITIHGHAPSDEQLVTMIRRLNADPVFTSVTLHGSREDQTRTHFVRSFHLDVVIDLDRRFVDEPLDTEAVDAR